MLICTAIVVTLGFFGDAVKVCPALLVATLIIDEQVALLGEDQVHRLVAHKADAFAHDHLVGLGGEIALNEDDIVGIQLKVDLICCQLDPSALVLLHDHERRLIRRNYCGLPRQGLLNLLLPASHRSCSAEMILGGSALLLGRGLRHLAILVILRFLMPGAMLAVLLRDFLAKAVGVPLLAVDGGVFSGRIRAAHSVGVVRLHLESLVFYEADQALGALSGVVRLDLAGHRCIGIGSHDVDESVIAASYIRILWLHIFRCLLTLLVGGALKFTLVVGIWVTRRVADRPLRCQSLVCCLLTADIRGCFGLFLRRCVIFFVLFAKGEGTRPVILGACEHEPGLLGAL